MSEADEDHRSLAAKRAKARAARDAEHEVVRLAALAAAAEKESGDLVEVRVLPQGADKVCTGDATPVYNEITKEQSVPTYPRGAVFSIAPSIAKALEDRGFVEIQP